MLYHGKEEEEIARDIREEVYSIIEKKKRKRNDPGVKELRKITKKLDDVNDRLYKVGSFLFWFNRDGDNDFYFDDISCLNSVSEELTWCLEELEQIESLVKKSGIVEKKKNHNFRMIRRYRKQIDYFDREVRKHQRLVKKYLPLIEVQNVCLRKYLQNY